jgi:hypothetical protein
MLGVSWRGNTYIDRCLPFSLRSAPIIFSAFADALAWAFWCVGIVPQLHYFDDFLFFVPPGSSMAQSLHTSVIDTCQQLGVSVASHKTEGPFTCLTFFAAYYQFQFSAEHVPGSLKSAADALSRNNINIFLSLAPQVSSQSPVSDQLKHLLLSTPPVWGSPDWTSQFRACLQEVSPPQQQTLILLDGPDS